MNNNVVLSVSCVQAQHATYVAHYALKRTPALYTFDRSVSVGENLNRLASAALDPTATMATFHAYRPIFLDLVSRWVSNPSMEAQALGSTPSVHGSLVLQAMAKLVSLSADVLTLLEHFLRQTNIFTALQMNLEAISASELEAVLLATYRIFRFDQHRFKAFISPDVLYLVIKHERTNLRVAKLLAVELLAVYLSASETARTKMLATHVGDGELMGSYEGDTVDFRFLALLEAKRLSNVSALGPSPESFLGKTIVIEPAALSPLVTSVCGILVPNLNREAAEQIELVPTIKATAALRALAHNVQNNRPVMLVGKAGAGKTFLINELAKYMSCSASVVKIHLGEQTDAKLLLGTYTSGDKPGTFEWRAGVLTTAVKEGRWVLIEDIDKAPTEVLSVLLTLLEKRELVIPSRGEVVKAANGFQLLSTIRVADDARRATVPDLIGLRLWQQISLSQPDDSDLYAILTTRFPLLQLLVKLFIAAFNRVKEIYQLPSFISLNKGAHPRVISVRDLMKFCTRAHALLAHAGVTQHDQLVDAAVYDNIFAEAVDCFSSSLCESTAASLVINVVGETLEIPATRVSLFLLKHVPVFQDAVDHINIGRARLVKSSSALTKKKHSENVTSFARTNHAVRLMEQIGVAVSMVESVLLVGETGTGKTTIVQQVAKFMNKNLTVINVSQQTETGDLLGGYKPVNTKTVAVPLQDTFEGLFIATFSRKRNERFSLVLSKCFNKQQWKNVTKLWREAFKMASEVLLREETPEAESAKKRKLSASDKSELMEQWTKFQAQVKQFEIHASTLDNSFVFNFIEGSLIKAVREGGWLLLDEINLASADTLESIADLLSDHRSVLLSEKGEVESIRAHPDFRLFGCMNPSTDVGKKDLPPGIRSRFSEVYVHSPDRDISDLLAIIDQYVSRHAVGDEWIGNDVAQLYLEAKALAESNQIVDGANQKPHFSIRTLTRTLIYVRDIVAIYGLRRSLYEGFCMSFLTLLDLKSEELLQPLIAKYTIGRLKNAKAVISQCPPPPANAADYVQFRHYWMKHGPEELQEQPHYIITPFVEKNMLNLVRATAGRRFPVLVQGPTSSGKTSMVKYLANITGHKFVRINNHEHTDLQEYLGTYVSDSTGKLSFKEGVLVEALRKGHWIVLDELNLAPTDVLEALNRLLDDNRELFIPETQEVVHPHPDFMLFATQNPPGLYGGRKVLSRAFRNRFLELHFDDIPQDELETILRERCQIAPSYGKTIVEVYRQLSVQRQSSRLFEKKNSFATLRDLFRWAMRPAVGYEQLAANGYMLLAERVRQDDEKLVVKQAIEKVMKVKLDMDEYYHGLENSQLMAIESSVVWTKAMRRLAVLVETALQNNEPILLVGETGCGKTTVCQLIAEYVGKQLVTINAHQNTETGDILGAQRPVRNRNEVQAKVGAMLQELFTIWDIAFDEKASMEELLRVFDSRKPEAWVTTSTEIDMSAETEASTEAGTEVILEVSPEVTASPASLALLVTSIQALRSSLNILFEWNDGPLVQALKSGDFFLLDEISLADDSVLERLNSVLEPERSLLLAEKGTEDAFVTAADGFEFLATMNPGGDYGKKELSPALRNRFTEIWVPSMDDFADVRQIVEAKLASAAQHLAEPLVAFSEWFGIRYGGGSATNGVISLRDILAWVTFVNATCDAEARAPLSAAHALLHGAAMVFIDALGTNNTAFLAENEAQLREHKLACVARLSELAGADLVAAYAARPAVALGDALTCGSFAIARASAARDTAAFNLRAPTTAANAMRVIRAMQVRKPILLEGSPGVGKTSLVSALAEATGNPLTRINLSEQTDLVDLFGSDAPSVGGSAGEFTWRDAPFLRAMQRGEWVLLDEMNLASQSVLEGLNACLDHRGEAFIPELNKSFARHPNFLVFAAQNPQYQGGGRKGLPKSFVNRFSVVYMDVLTPEDLSMISRHMFPHIAADTCDKLIAFMAALEQEVVVKRSWGSSGGPWEFNLRDTLRWLHLFSSASVAEKVPGDFLDVVIAQRFRATGDRARARELFAGIFGMLPARDNYFALGQDYVQAGREIVARAGSVAHAATHRLVPLQCNTALMESAFMCVNRNWPLIIVGPTNSGKTELVRLTASLVGAHVVEFAMNSDVDSMDILGGYEQVDVARGIAALCRATAHVLRDLTVVNMKGATDATVMGHALRLLKLVSSTVGTEHFADVSHAVQHLSQLTGNMDLVDLAAQCVALDGQLAAAQSVKFAWFDGLLVSAVERGDWLILDNANLCSPSVLDRLNSLLEPNGTLMINECAMEDGTPRTVVPHPGFRLFLTMDPKYGELSRAMRNRGIEVYMGALEERATAFDRRVLGLQALTEGGMEAESEPVFALVPVTAFVHPQDSATRMFSLLDDVFEEASFVAGLTSDDACSPVAGEMLSGVLTSTLPFVSLTRLASWKSVVFQSSEFSDAYKAACEAVCARAAFLADAGVARQLRVNYAAVEPVAHVLLGDSAFVDSQALHPLVNSYLTTETTDGEVSDGEVSEVTEALAECTLAARASSARECNHLFDVLFGVFAANKTVTEISQNSLTGKVNELSYIERSAAAFHGRNIKKAPRLAIFKFVLDISAYIGATVARVATCDLVFRSTGLYGALFALQTLWTNLVAAARAQDEARLRVYQQLIEKWMDEHRDNEMIQLFISDLSAAIASFGEGLVLTTGTSMAALWEAFRGVYPASETAWGHRDQVLALAADFDSAAAEQHADATTAVNGLRRLVLQLLQDAVAGVSDLEFEALARDVAAGIEQLRDIAAVHLVVRARKFQPEFRMLVNLADVYDADADSLSEDRLTLALNAGRSTEVVARFATHTLKPYPAVFDSLWDFGDGQHTSYVSALVTDDLFVSLADKCEGAKHTPGRDIPQFLRDMDGFAASVVRESPAVLADARAKLARLLVQWLAAIVACHTVDPAAHAAVADLEAHVSVAAIETVRACLVSCDAAFLAVVDGFFMPSLLLLAESCDTASLGKAWVLFACGSIQLYVPSSEYDPAITDHVVHQVFVQQQAAVRALHASWKAVRVTVSGTPLILEDHLATCQAVPAKPKVFRQSAVGAVFEEWKAFMDSAMAVEPVAKLLAALEGDAVQQAAMFQHNASQFLVRLHQGHSRFADLNDILRGHVFGLKLGYDLLVTARDTAALLTPRVWALDVPQLLTPQRLACDFAAMSAHCKSAPLDALATEHLMAFFMQMHFAIDATAPGRLDGMLGQILQTVYYRWSLRRMKEQQDETASGSLYKYADPSHEAEDDFVGMFPDYEEVMDAGTLDAAAASAAAQAGAKAAAQAATDDAYYALCRAYMAAQMGESRTSARDLVARGAAVFRELRAADCAPGALSPAVLSSLVLQMKDATSVFSASNTDAVDFYRGTMPAETRRAGAVMERLARGVAALLAQWPEHATLQNILAAAHEFLAFPAATPMARLIQKIEQVYTYIAEWEKYAHSGVSLKAPFDELTRLIVSWRQLELKSWSCLFQQEDRVVEKSLGKWWFHLFETIIVPIMSEEEEEDFDVEDIKIEDVKVEDARADATDEAVKAPASADTEIGSSRVLSALNIFLSETTYGEFPHRLDLVRAFTAHVRALLPASAPALCSLANLITFYEQFAPVIAEHVAQKRKALEKDVSEVILLASWKDVNVDALKQSARRSHAALYKLVRKYRTVLAGSVKQIIETGLPVSGAVSEHGAAISIPHFYDVDLAAVTAVCATLPTWASRAARLRDISLVEKNMGVYVAGVANEALPDLLAFARELQGDMEELRRKTPGEATEENKKEVAALKTQKRMLLAATLRQLRAMGVKTHLRADVVARQASVTLVLARAASFAGTSLAGTDGHFFRVLDLMPRLRAAAADPAEDVPPADVARGLAAAENLLCTLVAQRGPMRKLATHTSTLAGLVQTLEAVGDIAIADAIVPATIADSVVANTASVQWYAAWLPTLLDFAVETASTAAQMAQTSVSTDVFTNAKLTVTALAVNVATDRHLGTDAQVAAIDAFGAFVATFTNQLDEWIADHPALAFVAQTVRSWICMQDAKFCAQLSTSLTAIGTIDAAERAFRDLATVVMLSVQKITAEQRSGEITAEDEKWMALSQQRLMKYISLLYPQTVQKRLTACITALRTIEHNSATAALVRNLVAFTLPLVRRYFALALTVLKRARDNYAATARATYLMATALHTLTTQGFCSPPPPNTTKESDNLQDGTGLGDGEGVTNNSKDVEDDEDLTEDAQQPNSDQKDKDEEEDENDDAVDIEGDMAGELEDASDQEKEEGEEGEEEDLDEEVDDLDDLDPNAIDEKMWDEEAQEDKKEKESEQMPENSSSKDENQGEDEMEGDDKEMENDNENPVDDKEGDEEKKDDDEAEEEEDIGQQDDEVKNDEGEQLDNNVPETETLELPEDLNLDSGDEKDDDKDEDKDEPMDDGMDEDLPMEDDAKADKEEEEDAEGEAEGMEEDKDEGSDSEGEEIEGENVEGNAEPEEETEERGEEEEEVGESAEDNPEEEEAGSKKEDEEEAQGETIEGLEGDEAADAEDVDMESAVKQNDGSKGDGDDNQVTDEKDDVGASGMANPQDEQNDQEASNNDDEAPDAAQESLKQLGDSLKEFHRRRQEIKEAAERDESAEEAAAERPDEFEHVSGENTANETQALGAADKEQVQSIDDEMAIDEEEEVTDEAKTEEVGEEKAEDGEVQEAQEEVGDFNGQSKGAFIGERKTMNESGLFAQEEFADVEMEEVVESGLVEDAVAAPRAIEEARELWRASDLATLELTAGLCEQLRLILEPTLATKLKGDYKTGKRLNMKRIIPYIASEFRKDKIWLRRTKPSKRQYQIMIAVDDSKSMAESHSVELAFQSIALVSKALTQLESGGLSIVKFGETTQVVHPFDRPFTSETGARVFQWFDFLQTRTDVQRLVSQSIGLFETARATGDADLWQLQIIVSDGVCEDHATIQRLVRRAREDKIMLVFVVINGVNSSESILDMSQVSYVPDAAGNMVLKVDKYLDSFPFEFYVVVHDINELPEMLALILRQYFTELASA
ncbi:hypothetical protein BABINDRAFT_162495 [Babjeviella inositovora NRRL Y-12698]|uniref:Midasin n=1 Tax=Babjeviella inositovora NRRL Y-12698 TaxID=984486 RepID=A0A1E3QP00_9ASCO|nr:uncharacterized protein BABINDRAFT_162495 [Babjeviella inositovora NRRL Y-12698]ODQ78812.1 hypothetical protein BABINDRAFT_162495 [Babjeviella inositovora NRRL Y-12698]